MFEIIIVVRFPHRREIRHFRHSFLEFIGVAMQSGQRAIAGLDEFVVFRWRKIDIERHQTLVQERIDCARRLDRELRVQFYRIL